MLKYRIIKHIILSRSYLKPILSLVNCIPSSLPSASHLLFPTQDIWFRSYLLSFIINFPFSTGSSPITYKQDSIFHLKKTKNKLTFVAFCCFSLQQASLKEFSTFLVSNRQLSSHFSLYPKKVFSPITPIKLLFNSMPIPMVDSLYSFSLLCALSFYSFFTWLLENHISLLFLLLHERYLFFFNYVLRFFLFPQNS